MRLTKEGEEWWYLELRGAHELGEMMLGLAGCGTLAAWPNHVLDFERQVLEPLGPPPFTVPTGIIETWAKGRR